MGLAVFFRGARNKVIWLLAGFILTGLFWLENPAKIQAAVPATELTLQVTVNEETATAAVYSLSQLAALPQIRRVYSSVDSMPSPNINLTEGIMLSDFLARNNIDYHRVKSIGAFSTDGWHRTYTGEELFGTARYYYPRLVTSWDKNSTGTPTFSAGVEDGKIPVEPILAVKSFQARFGVGTDWIQVNESEAVKLCFGQTKPEDRNDSSFGRYLNKLAVVLEDGTPFVTLNGPPDGTSSYKQGGPITLSGKVQNLTAIALQVADPAGKEVFHSGRLDIVNETFSATFSLAPDAAAGLYTVKAEAASGQDTNGYKASFRLAVGEQTAGDQGSGNTDQEASNPKPTSRPDKVSDPASALTVSVGYYGGPYITKKVYTKEDLAAMPQVEQAYTFIDSMPAVVIDSAKGVRLKDILEDAGVDIDSVQTLHFWCTDIKSTWYTSLPKSYLLDTKRYYYPNLPTHWDRENQKALPGAEEGAIEVETILATSDYWKRFATAPDFSQMTNSAQFRLVFGQADTGTITAMRSARWVHGIDVELGGKPPDGVTLNRENLTGLKVGSTVQLRATVGPDDAVDKSVTWSSSNPKVATVDTQGRVTVVGPGTAVITVTTVAGGKTDSVSVNAAVNNGQYLQEKGSAVSQEGGEQPWRVFEMSEDAVPLAKAERQKALDPYALALAGLLFVAGSARKYQEYYKEVKK
jgi:DMSO/TMAO reductase YedYZ molybdopterin-dependent catalytic subunit